MSNCKKCKHCVYVARDYVGGGNKLITCDSTYIDTQDGTQNCKTARRKEMTDKDKFLHGTIKPLMFVQNHIINSTNKGDIVLDPFMGSGTTAVACKNLGRQFIGFEVNPKWHKIACDRLNNIQVNGQISLFTE